MLYDFPINFGHILVFPGENMLVCLKKETIISFSRAGSVAPIFNTFVESLGKISTSCGVSDGSRMGSGLLITYVWFSLDAKAAW